jgi:hypothetical protein
MRLAPQTKNSANTGRVRTVSILKFCVILLKSNRSLRKVYCAPDQVKEELQ